MDIIKRLYDELNTLPKGHLYAKVIHGKTYHYLQYYEGGGLKSDYIKESHVGTIKKALDRRNEIAEELARYENAGRDLPSLSVRSRALTGSLMMEDRIMARYEDGQCLWIDEKFCPLYIKRTGNLSGFLKSRAIDRNRTNSRLLKKILNITEEQDDMVALHSYGAAITDSYWFKVSGSKLKYSDISFTQDYYSDVALRGELLFYPRSPKLSPQLTVGGSYEKCWKRIGDEWWLYKKGSEDEIYSELVCSRLAEAMNIPTARYEHDGDVILTKNFADKYFFEPMTAIASDDDSYENVFTGLCEIAVTLAKQYLILILFDVIVNNVDRHNENCGLMRSRATGKIISLAPNFDNNLALISRSRTLITDPSTDGFIKIFMKFIKNNRKAAELYREMDIPLLTGDMIESCLNAIDIKHPDLPICDYILKRYEYLVRKIRIR